MDATHLHLILNHIPVLGLIGGFVILAWGTFRSYADIQKTGLTILVVTAFAAIPVYLTGEPAEEVVEHLPGVSEQIIELHEDSALSSLVLAIVTGTIALVALFARRFASAKIAAAGVYITLILSLVAGAAMAYTANLGGQIRHTEIRQLQGGTAETEHESKKKTKDDDD